MKFTTNKSYFCTMNEKSLKEKTASGFIWSATDRFGQQIIGMVVRIIIARILFPSDFGLIGILLIFNIFANLIQDSGFSIALIRKKEPTIVEYSTIFYFNIFISILVYLILYISAPFISIFFEQPLMVSLSRVLFLSFIFNALGIIQNVMIVKALDFKKNTIISIIAGSLSGIIAVGMVYTGFGVWSLVVQVVLSSLFRTILLWIYGHFRPVLRFENSVLKNFFPFSSKMFLTGIMTQTSSIVYTSVIGKSFDVSQVGFYTEATKYQSIAMDTMSGVINNVALPVLSSIKETEERLIRVFRKLMRVSAFISFPVMVALGVIAHPLIILLLTEKWQSAVPILQILCISGMFYTLTTTNIALLKTKGKSGMILKTELIRNILLVAIIFFTLPHGVMSLIWGLVIINICYYFLFIFQVKKVISYSIIEQLKDIFPYFFISLCCFLPTLLFHQIISNLYLQLFVQLFLGAGLYFILCKYSGSKIFEETQSLLTKQLKKSQSNE